MAYLMWNNMIKFRKKAGNVNEQSYLKLTACQRRKKQKTCRTLGLLT